MKIVVDIPERIIKQFTKLGIPKKYIKPIYQQYIDEYIHYDDYSMETYLGNSDVYCDILPRRTLNKVEKNINKV